MEKEKKVGRKPLNKKGIAMTERVSMSCTPEELEMLQEAARLEGDNLSSFLRSLVLPQAKTMLANHWFRTMGNGNLQEVFEMLKKMQENNMPKQ